MKTCRCSSLLLVIILTRAAGLYALPGDEPWDDRFGTSWTPATRGLALYRGQIHTSHHRYDGSSLNLWNNKGWGFFDMLPIGSDLFVCGNASSLHGLGPRGVARWDGTNWHSIGNGIPASDYGRFVAALAFRGGELYAGGQLAGGGEDDPMGLVRFNGTNWVEVGGGLSSDTNGWDPGLVWDLEVKDNILYVAGEFARAGDVIAHNIVRWDGTNWLTFNGPPIERLHGIGFRSEDLFVISPVALRKWSGSNWLTLGVTALGTGSQPSIEALTITPESVYIGGEFDSVNGVAATNIARWDGTNWWALGSGVTGKGWPTGYTAVHAISVWKSQVAVAGSFEMAGGKSSTNFAVWHLPTPHINVTTNQVEVSWWKGFTNYVLESSDTLPATNWTPIPTPANTNYYSAPPIGTKGFFRLRQE